MISFVWASKYPFWAGAGGSENYTAGQIRELTRRGIKCRVLTIGHGENDGRTDFPDIQFQALGSVRDLEQLDDTIVFVTYPLNVRTKQRSYAILHCPPPSFTQPDPLFDIRGASDKKLIATSHMAAGMWSRYLRFSTGFIPVVHPFAEPAFAKVKRPKRDDEVTKILFAGRLTPDKGVYTLMAALHMHELREIPYEITATTAGSRSEDGSIIKKLFESHPNIKLVQARKTPEEMAQLMAEHDIAVMPTTDIFWQETFGIVSVEAQHAGCRVVASRSGGLPETQCGSLTLVKPDDPHALAKGIVKAAAQGPVSEIARYAATRHFTVEKSVDALLKVIGHQHSSGQRVTKRPRKPIMQLYRLGSRSIT